MVRQLPARRRRARPVGVARVAVVVIALAMASCGDGTVQLAFRPVPGARATYRVEVHAEVVTTISDRPPRRTVEDTSFVAHHTVLEADRQGSRVRVRLEAPGQQARSFVVRLDRAGQLVEVQRIEELPASALGELGLTEIFPAAAGAPPRRPLAPGDRWSIDELVQLPGSAPARLRGGGRLAELGVADGRRLATIESRYEIPVARSADEPAGRIDMRGVQRATTTATHDLADGTVERARAHTTASYDLRLLAPPGRTGPPVPGRLVVDVRSLTRRLR